MKKRLAILGGAACLLLLAGLWLWRFQLTQAERVPVEEAHFQSGEAVPFGENFFWDASENPNGYTITVEDAQVRSVREFLEENGAFWDGLYGSLQPGWKPSEYVYLVTATVRNESNVDGMVHFGNFMMINGAILLQLDTDLTPVASPELADAGALSIAQGKERTFTFAFTPELLSVASNAPELYRRMQEEPFDLCISQVPQRLLIRVVPS